MIEKLKKNEINQIRKLWTQALKSKAFKYSLPSDNWFKRLFVHQKSYKNYVFTFKKNDYISGVIIGSYKQSNGYITMIIAENETISLNLLSYFEKVLQEENKDLKAIKTVFYNPHQLSFRLFDYQSFVHPNAPGVEINSHLNKLLKDANYTLFATQNVYFKDINTETYPLKLSEELRAKNITIRLVKLKQSHDYNALFKGLKNVPWEKALKHAMQENLKSLIVFHNDKPIGFAGPLYIKENGLGYFAGIGVLDEYQGMGIGKLLFNYLCIALKNEGATYMTLFTGTENKANYLYQKEGFKLVTQFNNYQKLI